MFAELTFWNGDDERWRNEQKERPIGREREIIPENKYRIVEKKELLPRVHLYLPFASLPLAFFSLFLNNLSPFFDDTAPNDPPHDLFTTPPRFIRVVGFFVATSSGKFDIYSLRGSREDYPRLREPLATTGESAA